MNQATEPKEAASRLAEAHETLQRVITAATDVEEASRQLGEANMTLHAVREETAELVGTIRQLSSDALTAVQAVQAIDPDAMLSRIDASRAATELAARNLTRTVWLATALWGAVLAVLMFILR